MRSAILLVAFAALASAEIRLIPRPRELRELGGELVLRSPLRISAPDSAAPAVAVLEDELAIWKMNWERAPEGIVRFIEPRDPPGDLLRPESYRLTVSTDRVTIESRTPAGHYYGAQTLRQLLHPAPGGLAAPRVAITDWPAFPFRGFSIDVSRGPVPTDAQLRTVIRTLGEFKMNALSLYMEHVYPFPHSPGVVPDGAEISPHLVRRLADHAAQHFVEIVPQQQTFAHLHNLLKFERYSDMGEVPHGQVLAPGDDRGYEWVDRAARELARVFPGSHFYILGDEPFELGQGRSRDLVAREGPAGAWLRHILRLSELLRPLNRKVMIAGDVPLSHPEVIPRLPKDLAVVSWNYDARDRFDDVILPFRNAGLEVIVCTGVNNWRRIFPDYSVARRNIAGFSRDGQRLGAAGLLSTHWNDGAGPLFNQNWYGIVLSAAAAWQHGETDLARFDRDWDWAFHRAEGPRVATAIGKLARIHDRLRDAGFTDAADELFWFDPFTVAGAAKVSRAAPLARELRLLAEEAALEFEQPVPRRADLLPWLRFAARRADHAFYKIQVATYLPRFYAQAEAAIGDAGSVRRALNRGASTNGRMVDLREETLALKAEYRRLYLLENRPYWLDNALLLYDREAMVWVERARRWTEILERYKLDGRLPPFSELGWHTPQ